jgi:hypothetical protein
MNRDGDVRRDRRHRGAQVEIGLHGDEDRVGAARGVLVVDEGGQADVAADGDPRRQRHGAVEEAAVSRHGDRVPRLGAAVAVEEAAARGREVALVAAHAPGRELELRVGAGERGRGDEGEAERGAHQSSRLPARIHRWMSSMSAIGSG